MAESQTIIKTTADKVTGCQNLHNLSCRLIFQGFFQYQLSYFILYISYSVAIVLSDMQEGRRQNAAAQLPGTARAGHRQEPARDRRHFR